MAQIIFIIVFVASLLLGVLLEYRESKKSKTWRY